MSMGNFISSSSASKASATTEDASDEKTAKEGNHNRKPEKEDEEHNRDANKEAAGAAGQRRQSEPSGWETEKKSKSPSLSGSVSDSERHDTNTGEDDTRLETRTLDPNKKRNSGYKRKLAESSESSADEDESLESRHPRNGSAVTRPEPSLRKHQVPQPKLPKIITHNNKKSE